MCVCVRCLGSVLVDLRGSSAALFYFPWLLKVAALTLFRKIVWVRCLGLTTDLAGVGRGTSSSLSRTVETLIACWAGSSHAAYSCALRPVTL